MALDGERVALLGPCISALEKIEPAKQLNVWYVRAFGLKIPKSETEITGGPGL